MERPDEDAGPSNSMAEAEDAMDVDATAPSQHIHRKVPLLASLQGPNHILVSRRGSVIAMRKRARKLLTSGRWAELHVHGLGAALATAVTLAAELVAEFEGRLVASASTSTEAIVDRFEPASARSVTDRGPKAAAACGERQEAGVLRELASR